MDISATHTKAALRAIKNAVIGNPNAKAAHALEEKMQMYSLSALWKPRTASLIRSPRVQCPGEFEPRAYVRVC